jgi:basic membrane lipoprotein Med (substrate-binding protein (PBP1-ABC) superfamily)
MVEVVLRQASKVVFAGVVFALMATACGRDDKASDAGFSVRMMTARTISGRWERAAERGLGKIGAELDADVARIRVDESADKREPLAELGRAGIDLVFCVGGYPEAPLHAIASDFPDTVFVLLPGRARGANIGSIRFLPEEAGYVAGAVAGALSPDGRTGILRGGGQPWLELLEEGYMAGFESRWRRARLTEVEGPDGAWELRSAGVLMALYSADRADPEVLAAAHNAGVQLVVTDPELLDDATGTVIAAIEVDVADAMVRVAREVYDGIFSGRTFSFDLGSGVLDVVVNPTLAPDTLAISDVALEEARAEITAGLVEFDELGL